MEDHPPTLIWKLILPNMEAHPPSLIWKLVILLRSAPWPCALNGTGPVENDRSKSDFYYS
eukprot:3242809-Prymnesium_polylepis.1